VPEAPGPGAALAVDARGLRPRKGVCLAFARRGARERVGTRLIVYRTRGDRFLGLRHGRPNRWSANRRFTARAAIIWFRHGRRAYLCPRQRAGPGGTDLKSGRIAIFAMRPRHFLMEPRAARLTSWVRPREALINAVGGIRAVINGTCPGLFCAESFMAGEQLGGGFVIINGLAFDGRGQVIGLETKYPGNNLFSLASAAPAISTTPIRP